MCLAFPTTEQVFLEDNYRSTSSILAVSLAIVAQGASGSSFDALLAERPRLRR